MRVGCADLSLNFARKSEIARGHERGEARLARQRQQNTRLDDGLFSPLITFSYFEWQLELT